MKPNFRHMARSAFEKAKQKLSEPSEGDLLYAALQLRMALEALTYDRATMYAEDLGPEQMKTWQPKQLMDRILEVDPQAGQSMTLYVGIEPSYGAEPDTMTRMGTDNVLDLATLRRDYHALGSYFHTPTINQVENGKLHDMKKLRDWCDAIAQSIEVVLSSEVWGTRITPAITLNCRKCGLTLKRRVRGDVENQRVECWECSATYTVGLDSEHQIAFQPRLIRVPCISEDCDATEDVWENDLKEGTQWSCGDCGKAQGIVLSVRAVE